MMNTTEEKDEASDLTVNNLIFVSPESLSLAVNRTANRQYFQRSTYQNGDTARIDFNSGSDYIDPDNSYLTFSIKLNSPSVTPVTANFGCGSAMNCIKQVTLRSRSGCELDRCEYANVWSRIKTVNTESLAYLQTGGSLEGWDVGSLTNIGSRSYFVRSDSAYQVVLPLKRLSGFFEPVKRGQKLPACLFSGLTMELIFEDYRTTVVVIDGDLGATVTGYTISNISVMTDNTCLTDDTQKVLNSLSSSSGLEHTYNRVYTSINDLPSGTNTLSAQVRKAVSKAQYAVAVFLDPSFRTNITVDSFSSMGYTTTSYQWRLGSLYFPNQPLSDPDANGAEAFLASLSTFNKLKNEHQEGSVTRAMFRTNYNGSLCGSFERDQELNCSGLCINSSRVLELDCTFLNAIARQAFVFLSYAGVSRSYLDNTSVCI